MTMSKFFDCPNCGKPIIVSAAPTDTLKPVHKDDPDGLAKIFEQFGNKVIVEGNRVIPAFFFKNKGDWIEINDVVQSLGGKWVSDKKDSHWLI